MTYLTDKEMTDVTTDKEITDVTTDKVTRLV